jgi:aryl-alcohol dehydrogenase-like predicted oxidoreductase
VRLRTDRIDVFHFHSCPLEVAQDGELLAALERAKAAGKIRASAYSGENEALAWAVASGRFDSVQCSVNLFDQSALDGAIADARARGVGVIGKRALGNAPWRFAEAPRGDYCETYWHRMRAMELDAADFGIAWDELALRFAAFAPGVSAVLVGTSRVEHLRAAIAHVTRGALPSDVIARVCARFDRSWRGEI